jgi:K+-sensing histidine kinase KdpD
MLRKNDGVILAELLLSLATLLMVGLFFVPLIMDITTQARNLETEKQATEILYDELQNFTVNPLLSQNYETIINGVKYQIIWSEIPETGQREVFVKIENNQTNPGKNICQVSE